MPSYFIKSIFSILSFTPLFVLATFFFFQEKSIVFAISMSIVLFTILQLYCKFLVTSCRKNYEVINFEISEINPVTRDSISFLTAILIPFVVFFSQGVSLGLAFLIFVMLFYLAFITDTSYYNISMSFLGYKSYEVQNSSGLTYILFSKRNFCNKNQLRKVIQINKLMVLDYDTK